MSKLLWTVLLVVAVVAVSTTAWAKDPAPTPLMKTVDPMNAKVGDLISVKGSNLGKKFVGEFYLTRGTAQMKLALESQEDEEIKFKVPAKATAGKYGIMVLTVQDPMLIEQPVALFIQE
jgi:hypothetical protein